jgi:hypothetical protein
MEAVTLISNALSLKTQWIADRDGMLALARTVTVVDTPAQLEAAGQFTAKARKHIRALEEERKAVTDPARQWIADIMAQEKTLAADLGAETARVKALCDGYATREAARIEAMRREEATRQAAAEAERQRIEAEVRRKAQADMDAANAAQRAELAKAEAARQEEARKRAEVAAAEARARAALLPKAAAPVTTANRMVTRWVVEIVSPCDVPRMFCVPDEAAIRKYMHALIASGEEPTMRGVKFTKSVSVEGRG